LLNYNFLRNNNTKIVMAFERSQGKIGSEVGGVPIYHIDELPDRLKNIQVAILTVPATEAQEMTNRLVDSGITGILNFTPARLSVLSHVRTHHIDLSVELQSLVYFLKQYPLDAKKS